MPQLKSEKDTNKKPKTLIGLTVQFIHGELLPYL